MNVHTHMHIYIHHTDNHTPYHTQTSRYSHFNLPRGRREALAAACELTSLLTLQRRKAGLQTTDMSVSSRVGRGAPPPA
ncbi:hypothetical protein EON63_23525, partial [archaeon]